MIFIFLLNKVQAFVLRMKNVQDLHQSEARKKELQMRLRVFFDNKISQGTPSNSLVMVNLNVICELTLLGTVFMKICNFSYIWRFLFFETVKKQQ